MKILHLCLASFYVDNYSYQENMLPKFHKELGLDVDIIASLVTFDENGKPCLLNKGRQYIDKYGIPVTRLNYKKGSVNRVLRRYKGLYDSIQNSKPDIIFIHGCQFTDIKYVKKYVKEKPNVKIYVDNHADFYNSGKNFFSKNILHKVIWRYCAHLIEPYTTKFYGVLPARVDFLKNVYKLPNNKIELLVMGADDEKVKEAKNENLRKAIREKFNINHDDFLIMSGGKIDQNKPQTLLLMKAVKNIHKDNVKLIVFGSILPKLKKEFESLLGESIQYIGWIDSNETYKYFNAADLVVFPGLHSVFWEQVVGLGKPCVFRYMEGFTHIDLGGNCKFLYEDSLEEHIRIISEIINSDDTFNNMKSIAQSKGMDIFSYKKISQRAIFEK